MLVSAAQQNESLYTYPLLRLFSHIGHYSILGIPYTSLVFFLSSCFSIFKKFYWGIVDLQIVFISGTQQSDSVTYNTCFHPFSDSFLIWVITKY